MVRVYSTPRGQRVVVDGIDHFDTDHAERVEPQAEELILRRLEAFLPHRPAPDPEPGQVAVLFFDIALRRADPRTPTGLPSGTSSQRAGNEVPIGLPSRARPGSVRSARGSGRASRRKAGG